MMCDGGGPGGGPGAVAEIFVYFSPFLADDGQQGQAIQIFYAAVQLDRITGKGRGAANTGRD